MRAERPPDMGANREGQLVGDRPSILDLLDLEFIEENLYRSCVIVEGPRARLFGGQVAAQALYVAGKTVPAGRRPHSLHGYFLRAGSPLRPTLFQVERDRDGHSFSARRVVAIQNGEVIFNMAASFTAPGSGPDLAPAPPPTRTRSPTPRPRKRCRSGPATITTRSSSGRPKRRRTGSGSRPNAGSGAPSTCRTTRCCTRPSSPTPPTSRPA